MLVTSDHGIYTVQSSPLIIGFFVPTQRNHMLTPFDDTFWAYISVMMTSRGFGPCCIFALFVGVLRVLLIPVSNFSHTVCVYVYVFWLLDLGGAPKFIINLCSRNCLLSTMMHITVFLCFSLPPVYIIAVFSHLSFTVISRGISKCVCV